ERDWSSDVCSSDLIFVEIIWPLLATTPSAFIRLVASLRTSNFVSVGTVKESFFLGDSQLATWVGSLARLSLDPIFAAPLASESAFLVVSRMFSGSTSSVLANPQPVFW